ncbi:hypothetical protein K3G39_19550 [Pontibacter sp. HSC-14F20]|uniref:hypothetical protein n=1 Tax=Pontibacter sp. HSC-14F20 TaxID=2864136 RepID=UPI001C731DC6|nr:hypothetical protein [Pontibacter sp. HSC-14F20]MBX0335435.1 hypothetical protein [Pontibacter sp. HSC-14F20]
MTTYLPMLGLLLCGLVWVHVDFIAIIVAFTLLFTLPVLAVIFLVYLALTVKGFVINNRELRLEGFTGLIVLVLLIFSPLLSLAAVEKIKKTKAEAIINDLEEYRQYNGRYPSDLATIDRDNDLITLTYSYNFSADTYSLKFKNGGLINHVYDSTDKQWWVYGWND